MITFFHVNMDPLNPLQRKVVVNLSSGRNLQDSFKGCSCCAAGKKQSELISVIQSPNDRATCLCNEVI